MKWLYLAYFLLSAHDLKEDKQFLNLLLVQLRLQVRLQWVW